VWTESRADKEASNELGLLLIVMCIFLAINSSIHVFELPQVKWLNCSVCFFLIFHHHCCYCYNHHHKRRRMSEGEHSRKTCFKKLFSKYIYEKHISKGLYTFWKIILKILLWKTCFKIYFMYFKFFILNILSYSR